MRFLSRTLVRTLLALLLLVPVRTIGAQSPAVVSPNRPVSTPYTGDLSIFEYPDRAKKLQIDRVMDILRITPGKAVADIGAGGGWFTVRAAARVGTEGVVFAEDINPRYLKSIEERAGKAKLTNIHPVLGSVDDPKLPAQSVDAVLLLKVYHEIADPETFMRHLRGALKSGARVGIIDRNGDGSDHGLKQAILEREMSAAGFREIEHYDFTKADGQDYFLVFTAR